MDISKYFTGEDVEIMRSEVNFADYNPRIIDDDARKKIKRGIKKFGLVGGLVVNKRSMTLVSGHQRVSVMDELQKYDIETHDNDYGMKVSMIDVDIKEEKELVILLNNPNAQGRWDYDLLRQMIPDIDYKDAGLSEADLSFIGVDYLFKTQEETNIANELENLMFEEGQERQAANEARRQERIAMREAEMEAKIMEQAAAQATGQGVSPDTGFAMPMEQGFSEQALANIEAGEAVKSAEEQRLEEEYEKQRRKEHMMQVKADVKAKANKDAADLDAYIMLSFDNWEAKAAFCQRMGYAEDAKFIKGEELDSRIEVLYDD